MKIIKDRASGITGNAGTGNTNVGDVTTEKVIRHDVLEDGTQRNISNEISSYDVDVDFVRFSHFIIEQKMKMKRRCLFTWKI